MGDSDRGHANVRGEGEGEREQRIREGC